MDNNKKSLTETHPEVAKQWHPTKNGNLTPNDVTYGSNMKVWWKCDVADDHEWESTILNRTFRDDGCTCCSGHKTVLSNCLVATHPEIAKEWHPTKNGELTPYDVTHGTHKEVWWKCDVAKDHEWECCVSHRTGLNEGGCTCCSNRKIVLSNCLATTHPELSKEWHPTKNGNLTPYNFVPGSTEKVWWKCDVEDDHEWLAVINSRAKIGEKGNGCPCCVGQKVVLSNCLATLFPELSKEWHPTKNGELTPYNITCGTRKKVWWKSDCGHEWVDSINHRTREERGCPFCKESIGEKKIRKLLELLKIEHIKQHKFKDCRKIRPLSFDFYVPEHNLCIEYDGAQHYKPVRFIGMSLETSEKSFKKTQEYDQIKNEYCLSNNIPLLRIPYWDFKNIEEIITSKLKIVSN